MNNSIILAINMKSLSVIYHYLVPQRSNNYRPQLLHPDSFLVLSFIAIGFFALIQTVKFFPALQNSVLGFTSNITIEDVINYTNQERAKQNLKPLRANPQLSAAALAKAQDMLDNQYWAHTSPTGKKPWDFIKATNYQYRVAGENLARDFSRIDEMMRAWMASPTHQANILNADYEEIGIAIVYGKLEGFDTALVVQMFGTPATQASQVGDSAVSDANQTQIVTVQNPIQAVPDQSREVVSQADFTVDGVTRSNVLSGHRLSIEKLRHAPLFSPLDLTKIIFLAVIILVALTLIYDSFVIGNRKNMRLVGKNLGHIILLTSVGFLLILFKGGLVK